MSPNSKRTPIFDVSDLTAYLFENLIWLPLNIGMGLQGGIGARLGNWKMLLYIPWCRVFIDVVLWLTLDR